MFLNVIIKGIFFVCLQQRGRRRRKSDRSDDEYDGDHPDQHYEMEQEEESKTIMLRCLPPNVTEDDVSVTDTFKGKSHKECCEIAR